MDIVMQLEIAPELGINDTQLGDNAGEFHASVVLNSN